MKLDDKLAIFICCNNSHMNRYIIIFSFLLLSTIGLAQQKTRFIAPQLPQVNPKEAKAKDWGVLIQNMEAPIPGGNSYREFLLEKKEKISQKYPRHGMPMSSRDITLIDTIGVGMSFMTNIGGHGIPNDNSMAISNDGILISAFNSAIYIYDTEADTVMAEVSLDFFRDQLGLTAHSYDPKLVYDPDNDRFILAFLIGRLSTDSKIITCFSTTNNPMDPWNVYAVPGNPLNDTSWSDYPAIAITKSDLYITMNLLKENQPWQTAFKQTVIWQIEKESGYQGDTALTLDLFHEIKEGGIKIRNMHPVRGGFDIKGPNQYFLSNRNFADQSDTIYFIEVTDNLASGNAQVNVQLLSADQDYYLAPSAQQKEFTFQKFQTNDSRVLGGILENNRIEFVQNTLHPSTGNVAVFHGIIEDVNNPSIKSNFIFDDSLEYGYPNIAYAGSETNETKSIIGFNHTSYWHFPGHSAVYSDGSAYSEIKMVKRGEGVVSSQSGYNQRWGDYLGVQRRYNNPCELWMTGYFGDAGGDNKSWASQLYAPGDCFDKVDTLREFVNGNVFPNPTVDFAEIHFNLSADQNVIIDLVDNYGNLVKRLLQDDLKAGENRLTFSTRLLASGNYFIRIYNGKDRILTKKIVKR